MKVRSMMIADPITISANASISDAIELMKVNRIRHLPVVDERKRLAGFLTLADLKQGLIPSMVGNLTLRDLMIQNPITVSPDDDVETAARIIYHHKIGGIPVVEENRLVGIITESDILRTFIDMMGILSATSRIDVVIKNEPGSLKSVLQIINDNGGDVVNVSTTLLDADKRAYYFRLASCNTKPIQAALEKKGVQVLASLD
jgi:acetoin utilization protein AcuB